MADCPTSQDEIEEMATRPYRELVGALAWLALGTRPDIAFATSSLARLGHNPGRVHWEAAKQDLRYLKRTKKRRLNLGGTSPLSSRVLTGGATATIDAQSEHILSRSAMELLAGNPRSSLVSHSLEAGGVHGALLGIKGVRLDGRFPEVSHCEGQW